MRSYRLRPVSKADVRSLHGACWPEQTLLRVEARIERAVHQNSYGRMVGLVAVPINASGSLSDAVNESDHPIAYGQVTRWTRLAEISDLVVADQWRNQGIGTTLVETLIAQARTWGSVQIEIGVAERNSRAFALYQRLGFTPYRTLTLDLGDGEEPVIYLIQSLG